MIREAIFSKFFDVGQEWENDYDMASGELKAIADYTGLSFNEVRNLPISLFLLYKKDAWVFNNSKTDKGKEFLQTLWRLQQTQADIQAIRRHTQKGGGS